VVKVDRANGTGWQLLTRKLHGALSGGEQAIALHLPLFAAEAAHYQAVPEAPPERVVTIQRLTRLPGVVKNFPVLRVFRK
jgi:hypothetical protein